MEKVIIVTGASRGIGREIAKELAIKGNIVIANYNNSEQAAKELKEEVVQKIEEISNINKNYKHKIEKNSSDNTCGKIDIFKADVSKMEECKKLVDYTLEKYKKIDVLINNAGISQIKEFTQITEQDWNNIINTNLNSVFYMSQEVCKNMIHNKKGCIINISSIWGITGASCEVAYSTSKAGVNGLTKALAKELGPSNIRINSIAPGIIDTEMNSELSKEDIENIKEEIPLERIGNVKDIEKCVEWLIDDEYTTGQIIQINGGWNI